MVDRDSNTQADGHRVASKAVLEGSADELWAGRYSLPAALLGDDAAALPATWTLQQLGRFDGYKLPCFVLR